MNNCFGRPCKHGQVTFLRILCVKYGALQMGYISVHIPLNMQSFQSSEGVKKRKLNSRIILWNIYGKIHLYVSEQNVT